MKKISFLLSFLILFVGSSFTTKTTNYFGSKITFTKGNSSIFKGDNSFLIEYDFSKMSVDGLETEEEFVKYKMEKKKTKEKAEQWKKDWEKDKSDFAIYYAEALTNRTNKTALSFSTDDPNSKYKMLVTPTHLDTGSPVKKSSVELRISIFDINTDNLVAELHVPKIIGVQQSPMAPTSGMRVKYVLALSANYLAKYIKKLK